MVRRWKQVWVVACVSVCTSLCMSVAIAEDYYVVKPVRSLKVTTGTIPNGDELNRASRSTISLPPRIEIDGVAESFVTWLNESPSNQSDPFGASTYWVAIRAETRADLVGKLYFTVTSANERSKEPKLVTADFLVPAAELSTDNRHEFLKGKLAYYEALADRRLPGGAWFRHQADSMRRELQRLPNANAVRREQATRFDARSRPLDAMAFFSGTRAIAENMQLDRLLPATNSTETTVKLATISGITVQEFDWASKLGNVEPKLDRLANVIPDDQYALFAPSFTSFVDLLDRANAETTPLLFSAEDRSEDAMVRERYQKQLCLPLSQLARLLGPTLIQSVAVTGADADFRIGADVAILFEPKNVTALKEVLLARAGAEASTNPSAKKTVEKLNGVEVVVWRTPERDISCYVAVVGDAVVVTNSPTQLKRLADTAAGTRSALAKLPEYRFFRTRYAIGDGNESGFIVISDKTIRRWCGPFDRIAAGRRTMAAAIMSNIQAAHAQAIVRGEQKESPIETEYRMPGGAPFVVGAKGVRSSVYGTLEFQTPIVELEFDTVTAEEARNYDLWRDGYQRYWTRFFDPIAVRLSMNKNEMNGDLSIMPLIASTEYRQFISVSRGAKVEPTDGDPHAGSIWHFIVAINRDSEEVRQSLSLVRNNGAPLTGWIGHYLAIYADEDPFWDEMAKAGDVWGFLFAEYYRLPIVIHADVRDSLQLALFLTSLRQTIESTSPRLVVWSDREYQGERYVVVAPSKSQRSSLFSKAELFYYASVDSLIISFREDLIKKAIDRQKLATANDSSGAAEKAKAVPAANVSQPWLGEHLNLRAGERAARAMVPLVGENARRIAQQQAWDAIPILNEWKRLFPDRDPVEVHQQVFHRRLVTSTGESYRWNKEARTMESVDFGFPGSGGKMPDVTELMLRKIKSVNFGLTFEDDGLRARMEIIEKPHE